MRGRVKLTLSNTPSHNAVRRGWIRKTLVALRSRTGRCAMWMATAAVTHAQTPDLQLVLQRLDRLEAQNQELMSEIRSLRQQLAAAPSVPPAATAAPAEPGQQTTPAEHLDIHDHQIAQLDQEKISTEHKLPLSLTGMLLVNTFWTGRDAGGADNPTVAPPPSTAPAASGGGTFRQSVIGVKFNGPGIPGGGRITGSAYADFFGGAGTTLNQLLRLRVASLNADWKTTTFTFALDKPIISPREPDSLAQVGVSPLTSAGNLWLWQPQVRIEQRFAMGSEAGVHAQFGVYQTSEGVTGIPTEYAGTLAKSRPGYQGRFEFWAQPSETHRVEIAPGFHLSSSRVAGISVPSRIFSVDWLVRPFSRIDLTGTFFHGENVGVFGGLRQGISFLYNDRVRAVEATGGWAQVKIRATSRLTFNFYGGQEDDRNGDLQKGAIAKNQTYAGNAMYRLGSNVLASFEASQTRTTYIGSGTRSFPHYDLGLAYLF